MSEVTPAPAVHRFQADVSAVLRLVIGSLYSNREIFLRELISNASDALDKLRFRAISEPDLLGSGEVPKIQISVDRERGTLTISDNGIGMTEAELAQNLGTVAWSGSREFLKKLESAPADSNKAVQLIGQFGVGFYSAYLVADRVEVVSRAAGAEHAARWSSEGKDDFQVEPAERSERGTSVILHLKSEQREYLEPYRIQSLVTRYSDYVVHPIELEREGKESEVINRASALWQRPPKEITEEQYTEFYRHLSHDHEPPLARRHFRIEGTQEFTALLFIPRQPPLAMFEAESRHGVRLHVRRVFVMDECEELVPRWLRFVRGVVDSEDLPLNVSRETLQDSRIVRTMRKQIVTQTLDLLDELASTRADDYLTFFKAFGPIFKEGLHFEPELRERIAKLLRYESSKQPELVSLDQYVDAMPEGQTAIYYATAATSALGRSSPHTEALRARGYAVLLMTDPIDPFVVGELGRYRDKPLVSAMNAGLELETPPTELERATEKLAEPLLERIKKVLGERVTGVRASRRLTDSPACLVVPEGALPPHVERMLRARGEGLPKSQRLMEVNLEHPLLKAIDALERREPGSTPVQDYIELVYEQALLAEGSPVDDPARFAQRLVALLTTAAAADVGPNPA